MARCVTCFTRGLSCQLILITVLVLKDGAGAPGQGTLTPPPKTTPGRESGRRCGDGMCVCTGDRALCSNIFSFVSYVPTLPENITAAGFSWCTFSADVLTEKFFANLTNISSLDLSFDNISWLPQNVFAGIQIKRLDLSFNNITWLHRGVFAGVPELRVLILDGNTDLRLESLAEVFSVPTLKYVSLEQCNLLPPSAALFQNITSNVKYIKLDHNPYFGGYNLQGFCTLPFLYSLSFRHCHFNSIASACRLQRLSTLDLTYNSLKMFPSTCAYRHESIFPELKVLILTQNRIQFLVRSAICLPSLKHLDISYNVITFYPAFVFSNLYFPVLERLVLHNQLRIKYWRENRGNRKPRFIEDYAFGHHSLIELDLSNNELQLADHHSIGMHAFSNSSQLRYLHLNGNNFTFVDDDRFLQLFGHLHSLVNLSMSNNNFESISTRTFANFSNLTALSLDNNMIADVPEGAFDSLHRLHSLHLHNNKIHTINERSFSEHLRENLSSLTLGFNPFFCSCDLLWFRQWYVTDQNMLFKDVIDQSAEYKCQNIPGMVLTNFSMTQQACLLSQDTNIFLIQFCSIFIFILMLVSVVFRYRWHLRLLMYEVFRGRDVLRRQRLRANNFDYDVFVSYASEDLPWVREHLMPKLENELGLRLCVHDRDFIPGCHIVDNIVQSVQSSKKILVVFSTHFVRDQWCQFELAFCLSHVLDYDDTLIVVCVDDVTSRQMTSAMMAVIKTTTYIQWREEVEDAVASFWGRLRLALHEILVHDTQTV